MFSNIFVVASQISSSKNTKKCAVCPVSTRKPRIERFRFGDTLKVRLQVKAFSPCFLGHCGELVSFRKRSGDALWGLNIKDAFLRGSCGGTSEAFKYVRLYELFHHFDLRQRLQTQVMLDTLVTSFNAKLCARVRKNFGNFNLRKRGTTTRGRCQNHFVKAMLMSPGWTKQLYIAGKNCLQNFIICK